MLEQKEKSIDKNYILVAFLGGLFFLPFLGGVHLFDWDEINFAECAREMLATGEYLRPQINFQPFWEKPPLFIWFQAISMQIFGVNEYAARFPNAGCGIATLILLYHFGKKLYDSAFGWLWVLAYLGAILPHLYFKSGIIDPIFNLFIFLALYFFIRADADYFDDFDPQKKRRYLIWAGIFSGLSILTKGPVGYLILALTWGFKVLIFKELNLKKIKDFGLVSLVALFTTLTWFGVETIKNGTWFIRTFIEYTIRLAQTEDAGHGGFVGYHFVVLFFGCFPSSIFALRTLYKRYNFFGEKIDFTRWLKALFWVVLIVFSLVRSKIVHYSSMCYFPLSFMAAITIYAMREEQKEFLFLKRLILFIGVLLGLIVAIIPVLGQNIEWLKPLFSKDIFAQKNLEANVVWTGLEMLAGLILIINVLYYFFRGKAHGIIRGTSIFFLCMAFFVNLTLIFFIKKIETYSQNAALEFYEAHSEEVCHIETWGYKSYAHLFYAKKRPPTQLKQMKTDSLLRGSVEKPIYFVVKFSLKHELDAEPNLIFLYEKNGFAFYKRR